MLVAFTSTAPESVVPLFFGAVIEIVGEVVSVFSTWIPIGCGRDTPCGVTRTRGQLMRPGDDGSRIPLQSEWRRGVLGPSRLPSRRNWTPATPTLSEAEGSYLHAA